jgi:hypothetical protein
MAGSPFPAVAIASSTPTLRGGIPGRKLVASRVSALTLAWTAGNRPSQPGDLEDLLSAEARKGWLLLAVYREPNLRTPGHHVNGDCERRLAGRGAKLELQSNCDGLCRCRDLLADSPLGADGAAGGRRGFGGAARSYGRGRSRAWRHAERLEDAQPAIVMSTAQASTSATCWGDLMSIGRAGLRYGSAEVSSDSGPRPRTGSTTTQPSV